MSDAKGDAGPGGQWEGLTDAELDDLERHCREATAGPWGHASYTMWHRQVLHQLLDAGGKPLVRGGREFAVVREEDAAFITQARTHLPRLLAEVRRLRHLLARHGPPSGAGQQAAQEAPPARRGRTRSKRTPKGSQGANQ